MTELAVADISVSLILLKVSSISLRFSGLVDETFGLTGRVVVIMV